ncbi:MULTISPECIES: TIGR04255 family protein [Oscillospiraceae]|uniref:TIGR04255 family protein n=1 Tax=Oscillospiraceae TaxID=216572 RepID=UPI000B371966|nr:MULTISPECIES: TIGR04255 family protein [Oscillospiraceae]MBM6886279.1 TIGR04255 family protein [Pseudoflavonifractor phocaeensis]OUO44721.1 TIGR04255 family protein [Flavonifractor sp. An306]
MLFAPYERLQYARSPLVEVICQLRFPTILSIGANEPAAFQEAVRKDFPRYAARQEQVPPKVVKKGNATALEPQKPITNYHFVSEDGRWKLNLTQNFIALSTLSYQRWEDFAARLDQPLAQFIQIYQPAFFERLGLRYVNAISRQRLGLEDQLWDDLIRDHYVGILGQPDVEETEITKCSLDVETPLVGGYRMKVHAGPGLIGGGKTDKEVKFILDSDFSAAGQLTADSVPAKLEDMHRFALCLFRGAITDELHQAMGPTPLSE